MCPLDNGELSSLENRGDSGGHSQYSNRLLRAATVHVCAPGALAILIAMPFLKGSVFDDRTVRMMYEGA